MFGNRGIYHEGWTAVTHHSTPWLAREWPSFDEDEWELYDTTQDWSQARDLSKEMPEKLRELQELFLIEASKFDGEQPGAGGTGTLHVNEVKVAEGRISKTVPFVFSADETLDIGGDLALPVTDDYPEGEKNQFKGTIHWVRIDLEDDDVSHLEPEELKYHRTMARQ